MKKIFILATLWLAVACNNDTDDTMVFIANPLSNTSWYAYKANDSLGNCLEEYHFTQNILTQIVKKAQGNTCSDSLRLMYDYRVLGNKIFVKNGSTSEEQWHFLQEKNTMEITTKNTTKKFIQNKRK